MLLFSHSVVSYSFVTLWTLSSPAGSFLSGIFQAKLLDWVAISSPSRDQTHVCCFGRRILYYGATQNHVLGEFFNFMKVKSLSHVQLFATHGL